MNDQLQDGLSRDLLARLHHAQESLSPVLPLDEVLRLALAGALSIGAAAGGAVWLRRAQIAPAAQGEVPIFDARSGDVRAFDVRPLDEIGDEWLCVRTLEAQSDAREYSQAGENGAPALWPMSSLSPAPLSETARRAAETMAAQESENGYALPLLLGDSALGVIELNGANSENAATARSASTRDFRDAAVRVLLQRFAAQVAQAMMAARLFQQLQSAKREWEMTFDGLVDGICIERLDGSILRVNRSMATLLGAPVEDILGQTREQLYENMPGYVRLRSPQRTRSNVGGTETRSGEFRFGAPERIISETVFMLRFPDRRQRARGQREEENGGHRVCVLRDVTERHRLHEQLLQSEKLAALGELVGGVAHELNNPLATVVGYAQLLAGDADLSPSMQRQLDVIHTEAARASRIVGSLLAFARREEPRKIALDINECLRAVVQMRGYQLRADNTKIETDFAPDLPIVCGDSHQFQQVFLNILNNAHQAMAQWRGGGEIRIATEKAPIDGENGVRVTLSDNGPGIAPDHLRRIFDPFFTTKASGEGTGLGMSLSLGIVADHGGRIWVESTLGHGARFIVELPAALIKDGEVQCETAPASGETSREYSQLETAEIVPLAAAEILVIDDEEPVVTLITEVLNLDGHNVTPAFNGAEALALLQEFSFDLILSDVRMPTVGGPTFFDILQTTRPDLLPRVIFVTGDTVSQSTQDFLKKAARPVVAKPFDPERLRALVDKMLRENG